MDLGLHGRTFVITGASRGIGAATARLLAEAGASLVLVARSEASLRDVTGACRAAGSDAEPVGVDVTAPDAPEVIGRAAERAFGAIDGLVNNAGTSAVKPLAELDDDDWQAQWELHVMGPMRLMRSFAPEMAERGWGRVVNVCSSSGKRPSKTNMAYSVTKAAQLSLSRAFADEYASRGVLVNAVAPGPVGTELWLAEGGLADQTAARQDTSREEVLAATAARVPVGRLGADEEVAAVIAFLCSERASYVAGAAWSVDGGTVPVII